MTFDYFFYAWWRRSSLLHALSVAVIPQVRQSHQTGCQLKSCQIAGFFTFLSHQPSFACARSSFQLAAFSERSQPTVQSRGSVTHVRSCIGRTNDDVHAPYGCISRDYRCPCRWLLKWEKFSNQLVKATDVHIVLQHSSLNEQKSQGYLCLGYVMRQISN